MDESQEGGAVSDLPELTEHQRVKLRQRLAQRSVADDGSLLPAMGEALQIPEPAARLAAVAGAAVGSRLLIPVFPHDQSEHERVATVSESLTRQDVGGEVAIVAFTCTDRLEECVPQARPVPLPVQQLALAAVTTGTPVAVDARYDLMLPVAALHALAVGDTWLAPWDDDELKNLLSVVARQFPAVTGMRLQPGGAGTQLVVFVDVTDRHARVQVEQYAQRLRQEKRVMTACGALSLVPRPVTPV